jgi:predicted nucleotidyltransferase component of viral defense system
MKLHNDTKLFAETIRAASETLGIIPVFIEKDYWITLTLNELAKSKFSEHAVFKGGTSLSKAYNLIARFSEDVDIAIIDSSTKSGNEIKKIIRSVEKEMTKSLTERFVASLSSKGSCFRKSVFEYTSIDPRNKSNQLIIEVNSFANPYPFQKLEIESLIAKFLTKVKRTDYIQEFNLQPFHINVLDKRQTLIEKLISLIRFSFDADVIQSVSSKIRHFYDLYYLLSDADCIEFLQTHEFSKQFETILNNDRKTFEIPEGWADKEISESPLVLDFDSTWNQIKDTYNKELSSLAFVEIPSEQDIAKEFKVLLNKLKG